MPSEEIVVEAAEWLRATKQRVSIRNVRRRLQSRGYAGGSFRDIGEVLGTWKAEREYRAPRIATSALPERIQGLLARLGEELWEYALAEAKADQRAERERLAAERKAFREVTREALSAADDARAEAERLTDEVRQLRAEINRLRRAAPGGSPGVSLAGRALGLIARDGPMWAFEIAGALTGMGEEVTLEEVRAALDADPAVELAPDGRFTLATDPRRA